MSFKTFLRNFLFVVTIVLPAASYASCGSASCPIDTASGEHPEKGTVQLGYQFEYIEQDQHRIGTRDAALGEIAGDHDEEFTVNRIHRLLGTVGLTDRWSVDLQLPVISRSHAHFEGTKLESWDFSGIGDLALITRYGFWKPSSPHMPTLSVLLGGEFPTGAHRKKNGDGNRAEPGIQPGSGSYDLIAGFSSLQTFTVPMLKGGYGTSPVFSSVIGQWNGPGNDDYRLGDTLRVNGGASYPVLPKLGIITQLNFLVKDRDGQGKTTEEIQKTGGEFLYFSPGLEFRPAKEWKAYALIQIPIYQRVNSIQVVSDYNVLMGVSCRFDELW